MKIILEKLILRNFKGVIEKTINFQHGNTNIFGANGSFKTTVYTAFNWLLTGKDEQDRKDYEVKNTKHKELNSQSHEVEGTLYVDGVETKLKRVYLEKWVKQKGQSHKTFEGHTTEYWYNDVPCNQSEYQTKVDGIIKSQLVKLATNPMYFNTLDWKDQRRALLGIAGDITDNEVLDSVATVKNDFGGLINALNAGKTPEELKKELAAKKNLLKKKAIEYPSRIDEAKRSRPEEKDWFNINSRISDNQSQVNAIEELLADASKAMTEKRKGILEKQKALHEKDMQRNGLHQQIKIEVLSRGNGIKEEITAAERGLQNIASRRREIAIEDKNKDANSESINRLIVEKRNNIERLIVEWKAINKETFQFDESACTCPTCKQSLPDDQLATRREALLKNFNQDVTRRKDNRVKESDIIKDEIKQLQAKLDLIDPYEFVEEIAGLDERENILAAKLKELKETSNNQQSTEVLLQEAIAQSGEYALLSAELADMEKQIAIETESTDDLPDNTGHIRRKNELLTELDSLKKDLALKDTIQRIDARIVELLNEEQINAQEIADLEQQEFDIDTYTRAKMDILQQRVNSKFKYVQFCMFDQQVNGGIAETCVCVLDGVPYPTLNTASKLKAGLDVLNTLSDFYDVYAPVFCDNRESVTDIPDSQSQIISLFVSPSDKDLRVEQDYKTSIAA